VDIPHAIAFSSDGKRLAMGYFGAQIWDFDRRTMLLAVPLTWNPEAIRLSATDSTLIVGCSWRGFLSAFGEIPGKIEVLRRDQYERFPVSDPKNYDLDRHELRRARTGTGPEEQRDIYCLAISPDGKRLITGGGPVWEWIDPLFSRESSVTVWDIATGRQLYDIGGREFPIQRFCLSPDGRTLYTCGDKVLGWDAGRSGPPIQRFDASGRRMLSIAVSPDGTMLAAGSREGEVIIWRAESAIRLVKLAHQGGPVYVLAFAPTSKKLMAAGERGLATAWDVESPNP
jgi:WD40 repeat protein